MISTRVLAVVAVLGVAATASAGLTLGTGASWPRALLAATTVTLAVAGLLIRSQRDSD